MSPELAARIPGAPGLIEWFGHFPSCHDGNVLEFALDLSRNGRLVVQAHRMNREIDDKGYFVLDRHCVVTFLLEDMTVAELAFEDAPSIIYGIKVTEHGEGFEIDLEATNGLDTKLRANKLSLTFKARANP